jgi:hypothetical protein
MTAHDLNDWWNSHPLLKNFYVPLVLTATFVVTVIDAIVGGS